MTTTTDYSNLLLPALTILDSLDDGATKFAKGTCRGCGEHRGVVFQKRVRLRPRGFCVDCLLGHLADKGPEDE
jgi:hypothetical protein